MLNSEMRRAAAKAATPIITPRRSSVRSLDSSDGFDSVSDSGRSSLDSPRSSRPHQSRATRVAGGRGRA